MKKYFFTRESLLAIGIFMFSFTHIWAQNGVKDSLKLAYWLYPKIFKKSECYKEHVAIVTLPYYSAKEVGLNMCICF